MNKTQIFVDRCVNLQVVLDALTAEETSDQVWLSVMMLKIVQLAKKQKDPKAAIKTCCDNLVALSEAKIEIKENV